VIHGTWTLLDDLVRNYVVIISPTLLFQLHSDAFIGWRAGRPGPPVGATVEVFIFAAIVSVGKGVQGIELYPRNNKTPINIEVSSVMMADGIRSEHPLGCSDPCRASPLRGSSQTLARLSNQWVLSAFQTTHTKKATPMG
jgi:hypothetical protein